MKKLIFKKKSQRLHVETQEEIVSENIDLEFKNQIMKKY